MHYFLYCSSHTLEVAPAKEVELLLGNSIIWEIVILSDS